METAYLSEVIKNLKGQIDDLNNEIVILKDEKKDIIEERKERYENRERELIYEIQLRSQNTIIYPIDIITNNCLLYNKYSCLKRNHY